MSDIIDVWTRIRLSLKGGEVSIWITDFGGTPIVRLNWIIPHTKDGRMWVFHSQHMFIEIDPRIADQFIREAKAQYLLDKVADV